MDLSFNGQRVMSADLILPHQGRWTADAYADLDEVPEVGAPAILHLLGRDYQSVVQHVGEVGGVVQLRLVGGKGGLDKEAQAKHYRHQPTVGLVLQDLLGEVGELLASTADQAVLQQQLDKWTRCAAPAIDLVGELLDHAGALWRVLADGTVWVGQNTWQPASADWTLIGGSLEAGRLLIAAEDLQVDPGQELDGLRVRSLVHMVRPEASRTTLVLDSSAPPHPLYRMVDRWLRRRGYDYARPQAGKAVSQDADGTLQVQLDAPEHPPLTGVPIRPGLPHTKIKIQPGARVLVEWEGGSPTAPAVTAWGDSQAQEIQIGGSGAREAARKQDAVGYLNYTLVLVAGAPLISGVSWSEEPTGVPVPSGAPAPGTYSIPLHITGGSSLLKVG